MGLHKKECKIVPSKFREIPDIKKKRIDSEVTLEMNEKEMIRAMNYGKVYEIKDGEELLLNMSNYKPIEEDSSNGNNNESDGDNSGSDSGTTNPDDSDDAP